MVKFISVYFQNIDVRIMTVAEFSVNVEVVIRASRISNLYIVGWIVLAFCTSMFAPSERFLPVLNEMIKQAPSVWAEACHHYLERTLQNGSRAEPPGPTEFLAVSEDQDIHLVVYCADGNKINVMADPASNSADVCEGLCKKLRIQEKLGFAIFIESGNLTVSLGAADKHILDAISEVEQSELEQGKLSSDPSWRLNFLREIFVPWFDPVSDTVGTQLTYYQIMTNVMSGDYFCEQEQMLIFLLACKCYVEIMKSSPMLDSKQVLGIIYNWLTAQQGSFKREIQDLPNKIMHSLYADELLRTKPNVLAVQQAIVQLARSQWPLWFSKLFGVQQFVGSDMRETGVMFCLNEAGLYVMDSQNQLKRYFSFAEIFSVNYNKSNNTGLDTVYLVLISGEIFTMMLTNAVELSNLVQQIIIGLKLRSKYAIAIKDGVGYSDVNGATIPLARGDLLSIDETNTVALMDISNRRQLLKPSPYPFEYLVIKRSSDGFCRGENTRTRQFGQFPSDSLYILPVTTFPTTEILNLFGQTLQSKFAQNDSTSDRNLYVQPTNNFRVYQLRPTR